MANGANLSDIEYMRDYIAHLEYARDHLMETYEDVRNHSQYIASEVWQDQVCLRFMEVLNQKQAELRRITEAIEANRQLMIKQLESLESAEADARQRGF